MGAFAITEVTFEIEGTACAGRLYLPPGQRRVPCVVLANGFSGTMDWILPDFAARFAEAGMAALIFDYRHLGASGGQPRQIVDVRRQRADLRHAIAFARVHERVDPERVALWGTSLGGGHVVSVAAEDPRIAAVIANAPALDAVAGANLQEKARRAGAGTTETALATLKLLGAAALDAVAGKLGRAPRYIPVYGQPGQAIFTDPTLAENFRRVEQQSATWQNRVAPRFLFGAPRYREGTMEQIRAPLLACLARDDVEVSAAFVKEKVARAPRGEVREYPVGHFELYHEAFEQVAGDQVAFLRAHLSAELR